MKVVLKAEFSCEGNQVCCQEAAVSQECVWYSSASKSIHYLFIFGLFFFLLSLKISPENYGDALAETFNNRIISHLWLFILWKFLFLFSYADRNMNVIISARPLHWSLLLLCIAGFYNQLVAIGNQSSRGRMGRCQTQPDQCQSPRDSLRLLVTNLGARMTVSTIK